MKEVFMILVAYATLMGIILFSLCLFGGIAIPCWIITFVIVFCAYKAYEHHKKYKRVISDTRQKENPQ
jgi:flagellar biosynthesis component FlhA